MEPVNICMQSRVFLGSQSGPTLGDLQGKAHHDIGACQFFPAKIVPIIRDGSQLAFQEAEVSLEDWLEKQGVDTRSNLSRDGFDEEWDRGVLDVCKRGQKIS